MNPISISVTGRLGDDPRTVTTRDGTDGVELRLAVDLPARGSGEGITRWVKVTAFGVLAARTAASVRKGDPACLHPARSRHHRLP
jgi:single-stranded DNA-binding protein